MLRFIKNLYKDSPVFLKKPLLYVPCAVFLGEVYRDKLKELVNAEDDGLLAARSKALGILEYAAKHVKFYKDYFGSRKINKIDWDVFSNLPILTKEQVSEDYAWFVSDEFGPLNSYAVTTGGTTGKQSKITLSNMSYKVEWAFVNNFLISKGVDPNSRRLCLRGVEFSKGSKDRLLNLNPIYKELQVSPFLLEKNKLAESSEYIESFGASWIHGYPSTVSEFCKVAKSIGLNESLKINHVLLVSEKIYPEQLSVIKNAFPKVKILTFYGMSERVVFAEKCGGIFYPNHNYGYTEEINGELVATGFINHAMPLIRYATGDEVVVSKNEDLVISIDEIVGRWGREYLLSKSGLRFGMASLNTHLDVFELLRGYQFYQNKQGECTLRLMPLVSGGLKNDDVIKIISVFQSKVGSELDIRSEIVDSLMKTPRGKHQFIVSDMY